MSQTEVVQALREMQFLDEISDDLQEQLAAISRCEEFAAGDVVFRQGDDATSVHLVVEGNVALEICASSIGCKRVLTVGPGEMLGWSPILEGAKLTATARCLTPVKTIAISGREILQLGERDPRLGFEFMKRAALALAKRLSATRLQLMDLYGHQMPHVPDERSDGVKVGAD